MGEKRNAYIPSRPDEYYGRLGQWISWVSSTIPYRSEVFHKNFLIFYLTTLYIRSISSEYLAKRSENFSWLQEALVTMA